jgi:DNA-binding response OmpR family regulator
MAGILLVEDEKELREMLKIALLRRKHIVFEAIDGREAIAHFKPSVTDLVVTDLIMPEEDGLNHPLRLLPSQEEARLALEGTLILQRLSELMPFFQNHFQFRS